MEEMLGHASSFQTPPAGAQVGLVDRRAQSLLKTLRFSDNLIQRTRGNSSVSIVSLSLRLGQIGNNQRAHGNAFSKLCHPFSHILSLLCLKRN